MPRRSTGLLTLLLAATLAGTPLSILHAQDQTPPGGEQIFRLNLPEWNRDPESLPPELRPLDVVRPVLPDDVAGAVAELEARIAEIEGSWLEGETRESQDALLDEAIGLAERVLALRVEHQGNTVEQIRWRNTAGEPTDWHEVITTRQTVANLRLMRGLNDEDSAALASLYGADAEAVRLYGEGSYADALAVTERQLDFFRRVLGDEHLDTLSAIGNTGVLLEAQGRLAEAEPYYREAMEGSRRVLGDEHPSTLISINNMGYLLESEGRLSEAEQYYREAMEARRRVLKDADPATLNSISNIAALLESLGRLSEAEPYGREALEGRRHVLGDEDPDTLISINNMGSLLKSQGRLAEAELYLREALEGLRRRLGDANPYTLNTINNVGALLNSQGRLSEAEPYLREALEGFRRVTGAEHPSTLLCINNMGGLLWAQNRLSEAEPYWRETLEVSSRVLGHKHPRTLLSINNMGALIEAQGHLAEAEPYFREALEVRRRVLGGEHPDTLVSIGNMGVLLQSQGHLAEAEPLFAEALATAERLRVDITGDASSRAQLAGALNLTGITSVYARTLLGLDRDSEALSVLERGRGRAGLDMFAGGRDAAEESLRATADASALASYDAALAAEEAARLAVFEAEARLSGAPDEKKSEWTSRVQAARRTLSEKTAAVFNELRGLVPAVDPMTSEQMLAALSPGEALLTWAWAEDGVLAIVARDGVVQGMALAANKDETTTLDEAISALRAGIAARPAGGTLAASMLDDAREAVLPEQLSRLLDDASSVVAVIDGPLAGIPIELLLPEVQVAYAPTATIALRPRLDSDASTRLVSASGVIVGDPVFAGYEREEPAYPEMGVLLAMVIEGDNADIAGLSRRDVLLSYGEYELASAADLGPAIGATAEAMATRGVSDANRPVTARVWRQGEDGQGREIEVKLALGRMGVQPSQAPPADGLRSMATFDRSADEFAANATSLEQIRFYGGGLLPLPATRLEAAAIAAMLGSDSTLLLGPDATAARLREAMESSPPRVLHLATHGLLGTADRPLLASVALTTPEEPTAEDNGFVTLGDILATWGGQLKGTELVVLSACDTASPVRQGDTMMALPLGLLIAGADTVVASLWKVDDKATALLMARFYANWLGKSGSTREIDGLTYEPSQPMPKLEALREAKQWLRGLTREQVDGMTGSPDAVNEAVTRDPAPRRGRFVTAPDLESRPYDHPFYWSAFVLYGQSE